MKQAVWNRVRRKKKQQFSEAGIEWCQMCGRHDYLSFAHRVKRREITDERELGIVALLCMSNADQEGCHDKLEYGPKDVMYQTVTKFYEQIESPNY